MKVLKIVKMQDYDTNTLEYKSRVRRIWTLRASIWLAYSCLPHFSVYICPRKAELLAQLVQSAALTGQRSPVRARHSSQKEGFGPLFFGEYLMIMFSCLGK